MEHETGIINIRRTSQFYGKLIRYWIVVDEQKTEKIKSGQTVALSVRVGEHTVKVGSIGEWTEPLQVSVEPGSKIFLEVGSWASGWKGMLAAKSNMGRNLYLKQVDA